MKTQLSLLALVVSSSLSASAFAAIPGQPSIEDGWKLANLSMVKHNASETSYSKRVTRGADGLNLTVKWNVWGSGGTAKETSVLLNGKTVWTGAGDAKTAPITVTKGGKYALQIKSCNDEGCSTSNTQEMNVIDTDGSGSEPLDAPLQDNNKPYENTSGKVVGTYYTEWSQYGRKFPVEKIPAQNLTHILYGFVPICGPNESLNIEGMQGSYNVLKSSCQGQPDYTVTIHDMGAALGYNEQIGGNFGKIMALKKAHPNLKILPSIGGWTLSDPFFDMHDAQKRATFVKSVKEYLETWKFFDGVDIDWEFPGGGGANPALGNKERDKVTYTTLMKELRVMLDELSKKNNRTYELTSAIGAGEAKIDAVDYTAAQKYMDYIFVMNYDFAGHFDLKNLNHQTSLRTQNAIGTTTIHSTEKAIDALLKQQVSPGKLVVGVAEYGRAWTGVKDYKEGQPFTGTATGPMIGKVLGAAAAGVLMYNEIVDHYSSGDYKTYYDDMAEAAYIFNSRTGELISYDSPRSVLAKGEYVNQNHLGGLFSWETGNSNGDLLNAMHEGLGHGKDTPIPVNKPPVAVADATQDVSANAEVALDGSRSYDPEKETLNYKWAQLSGASVTLDDAHAAVAHFTAPAQAGELSFSLTVNDGEYDSKPVTSVVRINELDEETNHAPVANAGPAQLVDAVSRVRLDGAASSDPDNDALSYQWRQKSGKPVELYNARYVRPEFTAPASDEDQKLVFTLTVNDGKLSSSSDVTITVKGQGSDETNHAPVANAGPAQHVEGGSQVKLTGSASSDPDNDTLSYHWQQKSGNPVKLYNTRYARPYFTAPVSDEEQKLVFTLTVYDGRLSNSSDVTITVKGQDSGDEEVEGAKPFEPGKAYVRGDEVSFKGKAYRCLQDHTGAMHWAPDIAVSLWVTR